MKLWASVHKKEVDKMLKTANNQIRKATVRALNKTATGGKTDISKKVREKAAVKAAAVKKTLKIERAKATKPEAAIISTGKPIALSKYQSRQNKKGVSVKVYKDKGRKQIRHAFIADMPSGHKGVFWRETRGGKRVSRLPIKELFGPSIPDIIKTDDVMSVVTKQLNIRMEKNLKHELKYALSME